MDKNNYSFAFDTELKHIIARNLTWLRKRSKLTQEKVGEVLNISKQAYRNYEYANREISLTSLKRLAIFYGISLDLLTSAEMIGLNSYAVTNFNVYEMNEDGSLTYNGTMSKVKNPHYSFIHVQIDTKNIKVFETNINHVPKHETLFDFKDKTYIGFIQYDKEGHGIFVVNGETYFFNKKDSKDLIIRGILLATIKLEYDSEDFFHY